MIENRKKFSVHWNEEGGFVDTALFGDQDADSSRALFDAVLRIADAKYKNEPIESFDLLVDVSQAGRATPEARKMHASYFKAFKVRKTAVVGATGFRAAIIKAIYTLGGNKNYRLFQDRESACAWLKK
jgi:dihydrodipicolinate reductase